MQNEANVNLGAWGRSNMQNEANQWNWLGYGIMLRAFR
jgi:hypothetical protein